MRILILMALRNLRQSGRRALFLGTAIGLVTALLVMLLGLSAGVRGSFLDAVRAISSGDVNVTGYFKTSPSSGVVLLRDATRARTIVDESIAAEHRVTDRHVGVVWAISSVSTVRGIMINDVGAEEQSHLGKFLQIANESEYAEDGADEPVGDLSKLSEPDTVVLFVNQAKRLAVRVGDVITARTDTMGGQVNTSDLRVVGVARDVGMITNWNIFTSKKTAARLLDVGPDTTGIIQVHLEDDERANEVMGQLREALEKESFELREYTPRPYFWKYGTIRSADWTGQRLDLTTWRDEVSYLVWILKTIDAISLILIVVLLGIISIGIINTMMMATRERTQEIGTLRAVGMTRLEVALLFILEALFLAAIASTAGALLGAGAAAGIDALAFRVPSDALREILLTDIVSLRVGAVHVAASVAFITTFSVLAAAWPAARAARLQPVTAMQ
jgi:putative ABC transport system permease protein